VNVLRPSLRFFPCWIAVLAAIGAAAFSVALAAADSVEKPDSEPEPESTYFIRAWRIDDGLPPLTTDTLLQAPEGYLWMECKDGMVRFDGVHAKTFSRAEMGWPEGPRLRAAIPDAVQGLWVTLGNGALWRERGGKWTFWGTIPEYDPEVLLQPMNRPEGGIHVGSRLGHVFRCDESAPGVHPMGQVPGFWRWLPTRGQDGYIWYASGKQAVRWKDGTPELAPLAETDPHRPYYYSWRDGSQWIIGKQYVARWRDGAFHRLPPISALGSEEVAGILPAPPVGVWASTNTRLFFLPEGAPEWRGPFPWGTRTEQRQRTNLSDSYGQHWIATYGFGFLHVTPDGRQISERLPTELAANRILNLIEDRERNIWGVAEGSGLVRLRPRQFAVHRAGKDLADPEVLAVAEDPSGAIWAGSGSGGADVLAGGAWRHVTLPPGNEPQAGVTAFLSLPNEDLLLGTTARGVWRRSGGGTWMQMGSDFEVRALFRDRAGTIWAAGRGLFRWENDDWKRPPDASNWPMVFAMSEDAAGRFWLATERGAWCRRPDGTFGPVPESEGLPGVGAQVILTESDGTVWLGFDTGLARWRAGHARLFTPAQGLPFSRVLGILAPDKDHLWVSSSDGLAVFDRAQFENGVEHLQGRVFTRADGLPTREASGGFQLSLLASRDGRCWLPTHQGLVEFDPRSIPPSAPPPPVVIEEAIATQESAFPLTIPPMRGTASGAGSAVPVGFRRLEFRFTAPSLSAPEKVLFRWRLEGLDSAWSAPSAQRTTAYSYVPSGQYRFHVIACNGDGIWNEVGASIPFSIPQHWHERTIFWVGLTLVLCGLGLFALRVRYLRRIERMRLLSALDHERARIAQDIHDDLGATLTQISMWSAVVQKRADPDTAGHLSLIRERSNEAVRSLDQIVWAVNPANDTVRKFATYICQAVGDFFRETNVACRINLADTVEDGALHADVRHHLVLAAREACTNALRHAAATEVSLHVEATPEKILIVVTDNGRGFDPDTVSQDGEGLSGMKRRLASAGGLCTIESAPGQGTRVLICWTKSATP
jgi:two-component sensor histidine kinase